MPESTDPAEPDSLDSLRFSASSLVPIIRADDISGVKELVAETLVPGAAEFLGSLIAGAARTQELNNMLQSKRLQWIINWNLKRIPAARGQIDWLITIL